MRKLTLLVSVLVLLTAGSAYSFDGLRKGFVLGGGLGFAPVAQLSIDNTTLDESKAGIALNILIGYAWDEFNMIVYEESAAAFTSNIFSNAVVVQGFAGAVYYHYFGPMGSSFFSAAGIGTYELLVEDLDGNSVGLGFMGGVGYEYSNHWQAAAYFSFGKSSNPTDDLSHFQFSMLINVIAF